MKRQSERKQFELLHNALGIMAAELEDVDDSSVKGTRRCNQAKGDIEFEN